MTGEGIDALNAIDRRAREEIERLWTEIARLKKAVKQKKRRKGQDRVC